MKKKTDKNVTNEALAGMVQRGFADMTTRFDGRFDGLTQEFKGEMKLVHGRLDAVEMELIDIKKKLDNIVYRHEYEELRDRVARLENRVAHRK